MTKDFKIFTCKYYGFSIKKEKNNKCPSHFKCLKNLRVWDKSKKRENIKIRSFCGKTGKTGVLNMKLKMGITKEAFNRELSLKLWGL